MQMTALIPMLPVRNVTESIAFYEKLGFAVEGQNAQWGWAMLAQDGCRLMIDQSINAYPDAQRMAVVYLYPQDVGAFHQRLKASGVSVPELDVTFYGMTEFRIEDPDGNRLWIGQMQTGEATL